MQKLFIMGFLVSTVLLANTTYGAGPSVSGGTSEAGWARSNEFMHIVLDALYNESRTVRSVAFAEGNHNKIIAIVDCAYKPAKYVYDLFETCREDIIIPGICPPIRSVKLNTQESELCSPY